MPLASTGDTWEDISVDELCERFGGRAHIQPWLDPA